LGTSYKKNMAGRQAPQNPACGPAFGDHNSSRLSYFYPLEERRPSHESTRAAPLFSKMKILSLNFLSCSRKACKSSTASFPLHPRDAELEIVTIKSNPLFIRNILPRLNWEALKGLCEEVRPPLTSFCTSVTEY